MKRLQVFVLLLLLSSAAQASPVRDVPEDLDAPDAQEAREKPKHAKKYYLVKMKDEDAPRKVYVAPGTDVAESVREAAEQEGVEYAELDPFVYAAATPNDPFYQQAKLWHLPQVGAPAAWDRTTGNLKIRICVADTGVNYDHPDLQQNIVTVGGVPVGVTYGTTTYPNRPGMDDNGHGTHCAGILGARGNNTVGATGLIWQVGIISCKFMGGSLVSGTTSDAAKCIQWCVNNNASVISASFGSGPSGSSQTFANAIVYAQSKGVLIVAAAGNENTSTPSYPAAYSSTYSNVVSVAATYTNDSWASYGNWGTSWVQLAAPGTSIYSTWTSTYYAIRSGTSGATAAVAGAAALAMAAAGGPRSIQPDILRNSLAASVDPVQALKTRVSSGGRLNVTSLLQLVKPSA